MGMCLMLVLKSQAYSLYEAYCCTTREKAVKVCRDLHIPDRVQERVLSYRRCVVISGEQDFS